MDTIMASLQKCHYGVNKLLGGYADCTVFIADSQKHSEILRLTLVKYNFCGRSFNLTYRRNIRKKITDDRIASRFASFSSAASKLCCGISVISKIERPISDILSNVNYMLFLQITISKCDVSNACSGLTMCNDNS